MKKLEREAKIGTSSKQQMSFEGGCNSVALNAVPARVTPGKSLLELEGLRNVRQYLPDSLNLSALNYISGINSDTFNNQNNNNNNNSCARKPYAEVHRPCKLNNQEQADCWPRARFEEAANKQLRVSSRLTGGPLRKNLNESCALQERVCAADIAVSSSPTSPSQPASTSSVACSMTASSADRVSTGVRNANSSSSGKEEPELASNSGEQSWVVGSTRQFGGQRVARKQSYKYNTWNWKRPIELLNSYRLSQHSFKPTQSSLSSNGNSKRDLNNNNTINNLVGGLQQSKQTSSLSPNNDEMKECLLFEEEDSQEEAIDKATTTNKKKLIGSGGQIMALSLSISLLVVSLLANKALGLQQQPAQSAPFRSGSGSNSPVTSSPLTSSGAARLLPNGPQPAAGSLIASVNCNKIRGHVSLTPNPQGGATVSTQIVAGPPGEVYQWSIHQFPVKPGAAACTCSSLVLGSKLIDLSELHGNLPSEREFTVQSALPLFGADSPVGHSLLLRGIKTGMLACATFLPSSRKSSFRAKFHQPLSGSVTIFQTAFGTSFLSHLMYANGTRRHSAHRFDLIKVDDDLSRLGATGSVQSGSNQQQQLVELREHENELTQCKRLVSGESALFKNSSFQLLVSSENFGMRSRTALVLPQIPFETFSSVYVIIYSEFAPNEPMACAPLRFVRPKQAAAKFQSVSVQGNVVFSQESAYEPTIARINLQLPNSDGHSFGIDELPMIIRRKSDTRVCPNIREIIYNPHHVEPSSVPGEGEATSDQYAVGDLSGKYGSLAGKSQLKIQVQDFNLPLFGPSSIVGRALTVYSAEGVAIGCSNVELTTPMSTAFATFDFGIQGQFIFRQPQNDCNGDTYVYIEVSKPVSGANQQAASAERSLDHNWHVHVNPIDSGIEHLSSTDCAPAGNHFNPYNTSTSSLYQRDCTAFNVLRCELGDLAAKMFTLEIPPYRVKAGQEPDIGKFFGTDIDLPLCGPVSIVNRSVVVHGQDFSHHRLACSTVIEFKPRS